MCLADDILSDMATIIFSVSVIQHFSVDSAPESLHPCRSHDEVHGEIYGRGASPPVFPRVVA